MILSDALARRAVPALPGRTLAPEDKANVRELFAPPFVAFTGQSA
jgi:hypothetical protein